MKTIKYSIYMLLILIVSSCNWFGHGNKSINIAIIALKEKNESNMNLIRGANLAVNELNANGGLLGRKINLIRIDTKEDVNQGMIVAEELSKRSNILAVIGHISSDVTLPASSIYERSQIIMITPTATSDLITENTSNYIFRMIPNDKGIAERMAEYFKSRGLKNVIIFYPRTEYGQDLANDFEHSAIDLGVKVVDRRSYFEQSGSYSDLLTYWQQHYEFDSMLLIGSMPEGAYILNQIREAGINVPIVSSDALSNKRLITLSGKNAEGLVTVTFVDIENTINDQLKSFKSAYTNMYHMEPDQFSLLGYDSIKLVAHAIQAKNSILNPDVAEYLHNSTYQGLVTGYKFDAKGNNSLFSTPYLKQVDKGVYTKIK